MNEENLISDENQEETKISFKLKDKADDLKPMHPIAQAIEKFIRRISDIRLSVKNYLPYANQWLIDEKKKAHEELVKAMKILSSKKEESRAYAIKRLLDSLKKVFRLEESELIKFNNIGFLLTCFSSFDAFIGELIEAIYRNKTELYSNLNRSMTISEMLQYKDVEDIKGLVLRSEIDSFRRKSYIEQFEILENRFGLNLKKFDNWPFFVECGQRRNLYTHCDGIISDQYLTICQKEGYNFSEEIKAGESIGIDSKYLLDACDLLIEVGLKLGHILWRKIFKDDLEKSESHIQNVQYEFLENNEWKCAKMAGEFATNLPEYHSSVLKIIMSVNYVIALKNCEEEELAIEILNQRDWSALSYDFRLAEKVLKCDYDSAYDIMLKIGKSGELVNESSYHIWPLFYDFRQSDKFLLAYKEIYGYEFTDKLLESAEATKSETEADIAVQEEGIEKTIVNDCLMPSEKGTAQQKNTADPKSRAAD